MLGEGTNVLTYALDHRQGNQSKRPLGSLISRSQAILGDDPEVLRGRQQEVDGDADQEELAVAQDDVRGAHLVHTGRVEGEGK